MKKPYSIILICIVIFLGIGTGYSAVRHYINIVLANEKLDKDFDPIELKERCQIDIKSCNVTSNITKEQAIEIAIKEGGPADRAKKIHAQYCLYTDTAMLVHPNDKIVQDNPLLKNKECIDEIPVWIVSFRGINGNENILRHGTPVTETNFVIDAITGNPLYSFSYR